MTGVLVALFLGAAAWIALTSPSHTLDMDRGAGRDPGPGPHPRAGEGRAPRSVGPGTESISSAGRVSDPALMLDLVAAILTAGRPLPSALRILSESSDPSTALSLARVVTALELGTDWHGAWNLVLAGTTTRMTKETAQARATADVLRSALAFAASSGAPSAAVLHAQAEQIRRRRARDAERRASALGVHLVLPLGLCALPAFVCLTVVPLLLALLPSF